MFRDLGVYRRVRVGPGPVPPCGHGSPNAPDPEKVPGGSGIPRGADKGAEEARILHADGALDAR